jgi:hypothetical protein
VGDAHAVVTAGREGGEEEARYDLARVVHSARLVEDFAEASNGNWRARRGG